ncbi:hypothetical protein N7532_011775 [Penicillium argentinense]|uniref:Uncharacterized protein n=1 Tax=Penicillium argentinense TaxID=1131581 RepID=A0A9W9EJ42_9EURO|nr:uncharacterized protein N7532_011775 [Penicillium argentinense]KAJ5082732.1 hypothetical protein N7532_011775 [Penicillium argentinense]
MANNLGTTKVPTAAPRPTTQGIFAIPLISQRVISNIITEPADHESLHGLTSLYHSNAVLQASIRAAWGVIERDNARRIYARHDCSGFYQIREKVRTICWQERLQNLHAATPTVPMKGVLHAIHLDEIEEAKEGAEAAENGNPVPPFEHGIDSVPDPAAQSRVVEDIIGDGCTQCFDFLVQMDVISVNGFRMNNNTSSYSYLHLSTSGLRFRATTPANLWAARLHLTQYILLRSSATALVAPSRVTRSQPEARQLSIMGKIDRVDHDLWGMWIDRVHELVVAPPVGVPPEAIPYTPNDIANTTNTAEWETIASHVTYNQYDKLFDLGVNYALMNVPGNTDSFWHMLLRRDAALEDETTKILIKMLSRPCNGLTDLTRPRLPLTSVNGTTFAPGDCSPWFFAMWDKKRKWAKIISQSPYVDATSPNYLTRPNGIGGPPYAVLTGLAAVHHFDEDGVRMLRQWVLRASSDLTYYREYEPLYDILEFIVDELRERYRAIEALGIAPAAEKRQKTVAKAAADKMTRIILNESIREIRPDETRRAGDEHYYMTLNETPAFANWVKRMNARGGLIHKDHFMAMWTKPTGVNTRSTRAHPWNPEMLMEMQ